MFDHDGVCGCGRRTYLLSICPRCQLDEQKEDAERAKETEASPAPIKVLFIPPQSDEQQAAEPSAVVPNSTGGAMSLPETLPELKRAEGLETAAVIILDRKLIWDTMRCGKQWTQRFGTCRVKTWDSSRGLTLPLPPPGEGPYRIAFAAVSYTHLRAHETLR